jgi:hypothetical protein
VVVLLVLLVELVVLLLLLLRNLVLLMLDLVLLLLLLLDLLLLLLPGRARVAPGACCHLLRTCCPAPLIAPQLPPYYF